MTDNPPETITEIYSPPDGDDKTEPDRDSEIYRQLARLKARAIEAGYRLEEARKTYLQFFEDAEMVCLQNEKAYQDLKEIRHRLIGARTMAELIEVLVRELTGLKVDHVSLTLVEDVINSRSESVSQLPDPARTCLRFTSSESLCALLSTTGKIKTYIGPALTREMSEIFGPEIASCVMSPLISRRNLIGCLNLGSRSAARFSPDQSPELLEDLAGTASLCVDNVITHERNERLATTDPLTGTYNRRYFFEYAAPILDLAKRHEDDLSCVYLDLNDFKPINDTYGHHVGDLALKKLVEYLKGRLRHTDVLARLGGDEFVMLLPRVDEKEALELVDVLREGLLKISFLDEGYQELTLSASFGVTALLPEDFSVDELVTRADEAMFKDKGQKRRGAGQVPGSRGPDSGR